MKKKTILTVACLVLTLSLPIVGQAYSLTGYKWSDNSINYYYDNYNSTTGKTAFANGASAWSGLDASCSYNASYDVYCTEVSESDVEWDGLSSGTTSGNYYATYTLSLNTAKTAWSNAGARKSVAVHEFGHVFGLNDNGTTKTIMNGYTWGTNSRYGGYALTTPQSDDKSGVNSIY